LKPMQLKHVRCLVTLDSLVRDFQKEILLLGLPLTNNSCGPKQITAVWLSHHIQSGSSKMDFNITVP